MKAILYNQDRCQWGVENAQLPVRSDSDALIKVSHAGLCGSDMFRFDYPDNAYSSISLGHEIVGFVKAVADSHAEQLLDKRVVINPIINCSECRDCLEGNTQFCSNIQVIGKTKHGGFSEYVSAPVSNVYPLPEGFNDKLGVLVDGTAVVLHACSKIKKESINKVLVIGDGAVAALTIATFKSKYPGVSIKVRGKNKGNIARLADRYGIAELCNEDEEFDLSIETVGRAQSDSLNTAIKHTRKTGEILVLGVYPEDYKLDLDVRSAFYKELSIKGVNSFVCCESSNNFKDAIILINNSQVLFDGLITHELALDNFEHGLHLMKNKTQSGAIKVIFTP
jgi:L-iditol 2-dehydrogenase